MSSTLVGLWFLVAEHLRLGSWDLIKGFTGGGDSDLSPRIAMQMVNEASLCQNRVRRKNYISHQGFELLNGLCFLASDEQGHYLLNEHTVADARKLQGALAKIRYNKGHYKGESIAIDPHRIVSTTKRIMPMKKKQPEEPSRKMLQTFFSLDVSTGQPVGFGIGSPGANTSSATLELLDMAGGVFQNNPLILADKEHFTNSLISKMKLDAKFDLLVPVIRSQRIKKIEQSLTYKSIWAGYAISETVFNFDGGKDLYRLISQREGERFPEFKYKSFITLSSKPSQELLCEKYNERWSIEEFFNFDGAMGFDRASTFNLNIRYGKMSLGLIAQAAAYQFRQKLPEEYRSWNALHLANAIFNKLDGDIRVKDDTIIVTCYNTQSSLNLHKNYQNLPKRLKQEGVDPKIPWLYNFKLDFRFK